MANLSERVDTTFIGLFLMGFVLLLLGVFGLQNAEVFGDDITQWPLKMEVIAAVCALLGMVFILLTVFAYRTGAKTAAAIYAVFGVALLVVSFSMRAAFNDGVVDPDYARTDWFIYMAIAIMFFILTIYTILEEAPKMVDFAVFVFALLFLFLALAAFFDPTIAGPGNDVDLAKAMAILYGFFGFIGFALTTYLGLAYAQPRKLPIF